LKNQEELKNRSGTISNQSLLYDVLIKQIDYLKIPAKNYENSKQSSIFANKTISKIRSLC